MMQSLLAKHTWHFKWLTTLKARIKVSALSSMASYMLHTTSSFWVQVWVTNVTMFRHHTSLFPGLVRIAEFFATPTKISGTMTWNDDCVQKQTAFTCSASSPVQPATQRSPSQPEFKLQMRWDVTWVNQNSKTTYSYHRPAFARLSTPKWPPEHGNIMVSLSQKSSEGSVMAYACQGLPLSSSSSRWQCSSKLSL